MANKKNTVLIVEDEIDLRELLKEKLNSKGFDVLEADNGKVGLDVAFSRHPDVILLDLVMPVMDGISMLKELRRDKWGKNATVIILSNLSEPEKMNESMEENAYGYLVKSNWEPDDVVALIRGASRKVATEKEVE
jgi:two-component system phosphate regulon response regulator PhoB